MYTWIYCGGYVTSRAASVVEMWKLNGAVAWCIPVFSDMTKLKNKHKWRVVKIAVNLGNAHPQEIILGGSVKT